jgi:hypothetical protein
MCDRNWLQESLACGPCLGPILGDGLPIVRNGHGASRWVLGNKPQSVGTAGYRQPDAEQVGRLLWMQIGLLLHRPRR